MAGARSLVLDVQAAARLDVEHVLLLVQAAEEGGHRHLQCPRQPGQRGQAGRGLGVLDLGEHPLGQAGQLGELADGQPQVQPELAHALGDDGAERLLQRTRRSGGCLAVRLTLVGGREADQLRHRSPSPPHGGALGRRLPARAPLDAARDFPGRPLRPPR